MRRAAVLAAALALCLVLAGCGARTDTEGLLEGLARQEASEPACLDGSLSISGTGEEPGSYVEARSVFQVHRYEGVLCMRDVEIRLEHDGDPYDGRAEIWTEGGEAYVYVGQPYAGGTWYAYPPEETRAAGIDPDTLGRLLADMADLGLSGLDAVVRDESAPGRIALSFPLSAERVSAILNRSDSDLAGEDVAWSDGTATLAFDAGTGAFLSCAVAAEGSSEGYAFAYSLDLAAMPQVGEFSVPEDVIEAARGNYDVAPIEDGASGTDDDPSGNIS